MYTTRTPSASRPSSASPQASIQAKQKRRERFATAGGGGNQRVATGGNFRPTQPLRLGRLAKALAKPGFNYWMKHDGDSALLQKFSDFSTAWNFVHYLMYRFESQHSTLRESPK